MTEAPNVSPGVVANLEVRACQVGARPCPLPPPPAPAVLEREVRGIALPDPPDVDVDAAALEYAAGESFETPPANGEYRGSAPVRRLPRGVAGEDLVEHAESQLGAGAIWVRGSQRVRITRVSGGKVYFTAIEGGGASQSRILGRTRFLADARPEE